MTLNENCRATKYDEIKFCDLLSTPQSREEKLNIFSLHNNKTKFISINMKHAIQIILHSYTILLSNSRQI